jgi:hypothetical protein
MDLFGATAQQQRRGVGVSHGEVPGLGSAPKTASSAAILPEAEHLSEMHMSLLQMLERQLDDPALDALQRNTGAGERTQLMQAAQAALPMLIAGLAGNAREQHGADQLWSALARDHDGALLDRLGDFLGSDEAPRQGEAILRHVFGERTPRAAETLSRSTGLDAGSAGTVLAALAPMVMGMIGKLQDQGEIGSHAQLRDVLVREREAARQRPQADTLLTALFDEDGDGQLGTDEVIRRGSGLLAKLFGRR